MKAEVPFLHFHVDVPARVHHDNNVTQVGSQRPKFRLCTVVGPCGSEVSNWSETTETHGLQGCARYPSLGLCTVTYDPGHGALTLNSSSVNTSPLLQALPFEAQPAFKFQAHSEC